MNENQDQTGNPLFSDEQNNEDVENEALEEEEIEEFEIVDFDEEEDDEEGDTPVVAWDKSAFREEKESEETPAANLERVSKLIARAGLASRRAAEEIITQGRVSVNGHFVREPGAKADPARDRVVVDNKPLIFTEKTTTVVLLHKPKYVMTTKDDQGKRTTVMELLPHKYQKLHPVGRLDYETTGVLLLSDDGDLTNLLTHPSHGVEKVYEARVRGEVTPADIERLQTGVYIDNVKTAPCRARVIAQREKNALIELTLHEGRNRQVRRMLEAIGHPVSALRRTKFGSVELEGLEAGSFRLLLPGEVKALRKHAENAPKEAKRRAKAAQKAKTTGKPPVKEAEATGKGKSKGQAPRANGANPNRPNSNRSNSNRSAGANRSEGAPSSQNPNRERAPRDEKSAIAKRIERKWR